MCLVMSPLDSLCNRIRKKGNPIFQPVVKINVRNYVNVTATDDAVGICSHFQSLFHLDCLSDKIKFNS